MQKVRTQLFMNQLNDAETGNADTPEQIGATGGIPAVNEPVLPPPPVVKQEPNVNIVNEYNSFNLANVTPPVPPKCKTSDTLLDDLESSFSIKTDKNKYKNICGFPNFFLAAMPFLPNFPNLPKYRYLDYFCSTFI